jgi:cystathionine beta-lyase/cystathionine gamma-synthase
MSKMKNEYHHDTIAIHAGQPPDPATGAIMTPIYQTATYVQSDVGVHKGYEYSRTGNPTRTALEACLAALEGADFGLAFASGMAATDTLLRLVQPGEHVLVGDDVYGGTFRLFDKVLLDYGLDFDYVDMADLEEVSAALKPYTRLVWLETPTNPLLKVADIAAICELANNTSPDAWIAVDNTFASPYLQQPLSLGADFVVHSTTKYLGGHSDVVGGAVLTRDEEAYHRLQFLQNAVGAVPGPMDCWLVLRGMKTLGLRMQRHCDNARRVAEYLADHPAVAQVYFPGLPDDPGHETASRQMRDYGGMVSIVVSGGQEAARKVVTGTRLFALAESLGGVESLIEHPTSMTHASVAESSLAVDPGLVRLSVGIEHIDDLIADLEQALQRV